MRGVAAAVLGLAGCALATSGAHAQTRQPLVAVGLFAGASSPIGDFADDSRLGYHLGTRLALRAGNSPFGIRAEIQWHRFATKVSTSGQSIAGATSRPTDVFPILVNLDVMQDAGDGSVYLTGGVGGYQRRATAFSTIGGVTMPVGSISTSFGVNAGVGASFEVRGQNAFVELRLHRVSDDVYQIGPGGSNRPTLFVPISVGIRF